MNARFQEKYDNIFMATMLMLALSICSLSYMPYFMGAYSFTNSVMDDRIYFSLSALCIIVFMIIVNFSKFIDSLIKLRINQIVISFCTISLLFSIINFKLYFDSIYPFCVALFVFVSGTVFSFRVRAVKTIMYEYIIVTFIVGLYTIISYGGTFELVDTYLFSHKNSICVIWGTCSIILAYFAVSSKFGILGIINICGMIAFIIMISIARGRAALLATLLCIIFIFIRKLMKLRKVSLSGVIVFSLMAIILIGIISIKLEGLGFLSHAFLGVNKEYTDMDDFSSGRLTLLEMGIKKFISNPMLGGLYDNENFGMVHNYPMRILASYGLVGGCTYLIIYILFMVKILKGMFSTKFNNFEIWNVGYFIMAELYIVSMFEPLAPFGPGTVSFIGFFMLGMAVRCEATEYRGQHIPAFPLSPYPKNNAPYMSHI